MPSSSYIFLIKTSRLFINKTALTLLLGLICAACYSQKPVYSVANAHSHNDYENNFPFTTAYNEQFGSIEADIFLWHDSLIVGHTANDIQYKRTLEQLYLDPLQKKVIDNKGFPYKDTLRSLQLLIDVKTEAIPTINKLKEILAGYPLLIRSAKISFVITGNRPAISTYGSYPSYILFDGNLKQTYTSSELLKIPMFSDDLKAYTMWNGKGNIPKPDRILLDSFIQKVHQLGKKIRFWDSPDVPDAWYQFIHLGVDYINTDKIVELSSYFKNLALHN